MWIPIAVALLPLAVTWILTEGDGAARETASLLWILSVCVIGGIGSIRGAFLASIFVGLIDTVGRVFLPDLFKLIMSTEAAASAAPAMSSMLIYLLMAVVLVLRPEGLFPVSGK